jgi:two-component system sensor histidine kinase UhpB
MSLRLRIVIAITLLLLTGSVIGLAAAGWQADRVLREELEAAIAGGRLSVIAGLGELPRSSDRDLARLVGAFDGARHVKASLIDGDGTVIAVSHPLPVTPAPEWFAALFHPDVAAVRLRAPGAPFVLVLAPVAANDIAALWSEFLDLTGVLALSLGLGSVLIWLTVGQALRPLSDLSGALDRIGQGDYGAKVREAGPAELVKVGRAANDMARRLAAMQARTQRLEDQIATLQEEERADLARDLHDEIGPHLFAVNVDAAMARRLVDDGQAGEAARQLEAIQVSVAHMQRLVRDILGRLRPGELIDLGLAAAISELAAFWRARHPDIVFDVQVADDDRLALEPGARETLYRVVQESLNNAIRHGRPSLIRIAVGRASDGEVFAEVSDNGSSAGKPEGTGYGLIGMRERVAAAGGELALAKAASGWRVGVRLPATLAEALEPSS